MTGRENIGELCRVDHGARELPDHTYDVLAPRRSDVVVIIPVWNEGLRFIRQLSALAGHAHVADIMITDGSSTDGSVDLRILTASSVHALVTVFERGPSLALQPAIAHALDEGYSGVILMDGNGKDDPSMLDRFVEALRAGADYAQGSRYIPGGRGVNTPRYRDLLIRLVHAPLFSLACGRWFTDSTIGSRAFSRRMLVDPRVRPFRRAFRFYELWFYLGWAACRYGFRVTDVPVTRTYPATGPIPTKISVTRGHWRMLRPLIMLLLRRY